jgi:hypothetical protein
MIAKDGARREVETSLAKVNVLSDIIGFILAFYQVDLRSYTSVSEVQSYFTLMNLQ